MATNFLRFKNLHGHIPDSELENAVSIKIQPSGVKRPFWIEAFCPSATIFATDSIRPKRDIEKSKKRRAALRLKKKVIEDAREKGEEEFLVARNNTGLFRAAQKQKSKKEKENEKTLPRLLHKNMYHLYWRKNLSRTMNLCGGQKQKNKKEKEKKITLLRLLWIMINMKCKRVPEVRMYMPVYLLPSQDRGSELMLGSCE